jgi:protein-S-isoprenylcysteine O-methyltransferase Ste14
MYLAVAGIIVGQAFVLGQLVLLLYAGAFVIATAAFVRGYEEPTLKRRYGAQYERYRRAVPGWWPRRPTQTSRRASSCRRSSGSP